MLAMHNSNASFMRKRFTGSMAGGTEIYPYQNVSLYNPVPEVNGRGSVLIENCSRNSIILSPNS